MAAFMVSGTGGDPKLGKQLPSPLDEDQVHEDKMSKQLLYNEKYSECYKEEKLRIVGKQKDNLSMSRCQSKTFSVPQSAVLSKLKDFLPQLSSANKDMASQVTDNPEFAKNFDIEQISSDDQPHIEMNLSMIPSELLEEGEDNSSDESSSELGSESESSNDSEKSSPEIAHLRLTRKNGASTKKPSIVEIESSNIEKTDLNDR